MVVRRVTVMFKAKVKVWVFIFRFDNGYAAGLEAGAHDRDFCPKVVRFGAAR